MGGEFLEREKEDLAGGKPLREYIEIGISND